MNTLKQRLYQKIFALRAQLKYPALKTAYSIESHLTSEERLMLFELAQGKKTILEIGSYMGASACCFGAALKNSLDGRIFCIDTWQNDAMTEGKKDTSELFLKNTIAFKKVIIPVKGYSTEVAHIVQAKTSVIDVLFIDGDHSYEGAKSDWETYKDFLVEGSLVIFHDYGWAEGVKRVIEEDAKQVISNYDSLPNMWWGTINRKP